ncbi:hypothetical protein [Azospirillum palustre]
MGAPDGFAREPVIRQPHSVVRRRSHVSELFPGSVRPSSGAVPFGNRSWRRILPFQLLVW